MRPDRRRTRGAGPPGGGAAVRGLVAAFAAVLAPVVWAQEPPLPAPPAPPAQAPAPRQDPAPVTPPEAPPPEEPVRPKPRPAAPPPPPVPAPAEPAPSRPSARLPRASEASRGVEAWRPQVEQVLLSGEIAYAGAYRDEFFDRLFKRSVGPLPKSESWSAARTALAARFELAGDVTADVTLETAGDVFAFERRRVGDDRQTVRFREGAVTLGPGVCGWTRDDVEASLRLGIQHVRFELRRLGPDGHPFLLDAQESENPYTGTPTLAARWNGIPTFLPLSANPFLGGNAWWNNLVAQPKTGEAGGARFSARLLRAPRAPIHMDLDVGAFTLVEAGADVDLALVNLDVAFGAADPAHGLPDHASLVNVLLVGFGNEDAVVASAGVGLDWLSPWNVVEVFGEAHWQTGEYLDADVVGGGRLRVQHRAVGGYGGVRLQAPWLEGALAGRPFVECAGWYLSGDDGNVADDNADFLSLENVNQALLLEGKDVGLDVDTNYRAVKAEAGITLCRVLDVSVFAGWFRLNARPKVLPRPSPQLGAEFDLRLRWRPSETVTVTLAVATLQQARFFEDTGRGEDEGWAGTVGATLRF